MLVEICWTNPARKALRRIPARDREALRSRLLAVANDPQGAHPFVTPLTGRPGTFRVRAGDWRALYDLDHEAGMLNVIDTGHRRDVYRNL